MIEFLLPALVAGLAVAMVAGPLGCQLVWRRLAFFGDTLSHGALLGVALGTLLAIDVTLAVILCATLIALGLYLLQRQQRDLGADTLLSVLAHTALAFGMIAVSVIEGARPNLVGLLFGDILFVTPTDAVLIAVGAALLLGVLVAAWRPITSATVQEDLARVEGVNTEAVKLLLVVLLALMVAFAMKIVGLLLITALLIVPAATARRFARDPGAMAVIASLIGGVSVAAGMTASWYADLPAGPAIVASAAVLFVLSRLARSRA
ncbi:MAG: iron chelate uptake ABC transporter family permease subunit [Gammaproteobacteria bacterium]